MFDMADNVVKLGGVERPHEVALVTAIEDVIDEIAVDKMTYPEIVGILHTIAFRYAAASYENGE